MSNLPDIQTLAEALAIPLQPEWHATIRANLEISLRLANLVADIPLPDEIDLAPIFHP